MEYPIYLAQAFQAGDLLEQISQLAHIPLSLVIKVTAYATALRLLFYFYLTKTPAYKRFGVYRIFDVLNELVDAVVYAAMIVFFLIRPYVAQTFYIPSDSMTKTINSGDYILANKIIYRLNQPKIGDVAIFRPPPEGQVDSKNNHYVKRVIGKEGDVIEVKNGKLFRNHTLVKEPYLNEPKMNYDFKLVKHMGRLWPLIITSKGVNDPTSAHPIAKEFIITDRNLMNKLKNRPAEKIPRGEYLLMGDNRNVSFDSRGWGLLKAKNLIGRSEFRWLPISRIGMTR